MGGKALGVFMSETDGITSLRTEVGSTIGFYGVTPVTQRASDSQLALSASVVNASASNGAATWGFASSTQATQVVTLVNELRAALVALGAIKGSV